MVKARWESGLSQGEVAELLGVTQNTVSMWELGKKYPRKRNRAEIVSLYGKSEAELFEGCEQAPRR